MEGSTNSRNGDNENTGDDILMSEASTTTAEQPDDNMDEDERASSSIRLSDLLQAASSPDTKQLAILLNRQEKYGSKGSVSWMEELIMNLLPQPGNRMDNEEIQQALVLVGRLVQYDPDSWLLPIAKGVAQRIAQASHVIISDAVLQIWVDQMLQTTQIPVHILLFQALLQALRSQPGPFLRLAVYDETEFLTIWEESLKSRDKSVVAVRCATFFLESLLGTGSHDSTIFAKAQQAGATNLLLQMLQDSSDPLLQISVLDLVASSLETPPASVGAEPRQLLPGEETLAWLTGAAFATPILDMLEDPLLAGPALHCVSRLLALLLTVSMPTSDDAQQASQRLSQRILRHIQEEIGVTTNETDRLAVVDSLVQLSHSPGFLEASILEAPAIRTAWWGDLSRIANPQLPAAIVSSLAQVVQHLAIAEADSARLGVRVYVQFGLDNGVPDGTNTTDWLSTKYATSPLAELKIATYTLWEALACHTTGMTLLSASEAFWRIVLEPNREDTTEARLAKYALRKTVHRASQGFLASSLQRKLESLIGVGPHGRIAGPSHDTALE